MKTLRIAYVLAGGLAAGLSAASASDRPNILVIFTDQQSADALGSRVGGGWLHTPHLDALARRGVSFTRAYCANPICVPSRTSMLTGRFPHETGVLDNEKVSFDPAAWPTIGTLFQQAGYDTGYIGKWHLPYPVTDAASGFTFSTVSRNNGIDEQIPPAVDTFLRQKRGRPFLLFASFINPHNICEWPRGQKLPDGPIGEPPPPDQCPPAPANLAPQRDEPDALSAARRSYHSNPQFPVSGFDADRWRQYRWAYFRMIEKVDAQIGAVLASLAASGHADDTVVLFTSDHGDCQGAHGWNQKTVFYDEASRVPFIIAAPGMPAAGRDDPTLVQTGVDLLPTLCDFAEISLPAGLHGVSRRLVATTSPNSSYAVVSNHLTQGGRSRETDSAPHGRMFCTERYKYCVYDQGKLRESLVDLSADPGEMTNLAINPAYIDILREHRARLLDWARQTGDRSFPYIAPDAALPISVTVDFPSK